MPPSPPASLPQSCMQVMDQAAPLVESIAATGTPPARQPTSSTRSQHPPPSSWLPLPSHAGDGSGGTTAGVSQPPLAHLLPPLHAGGGAGDERAVRARGQRAAQGELTQGILSHTSDMSLTHFDAGIDNTSQSVTARCLAHDIFGEQATHSVPTFENPHSAHTFAGV